MYRSTARRWATKSVHGPRVRSHAHLPVVVVELDEELGQRCDLTFEEQQRRGGIERIAATRRRRTEDVHARLGRRRFGDDIAERRDRVLQCSRHARPLGIDSQHGVDVVTVDRVDGVERPGGKQIVDVVSVHAHSTTPSDPSALARRLRPRRSRDLAVPSCAPVATATSRNVSPSK